MREENNWTNSKGEARRGRNLCFFEGLSAFSSFGELGCFRFREEEESDGEEPASHNDHNNTPNTRATLNQFRIGFFLKLGEQHPSFFSEIKDPRLGVGRQATALQVLDFDKLVSNEFKGTQSTWRSRKELAAKDRQIQRTRYRCLCCGSSQENQNLRKSNRQNKATEQDIRTRRQHKQHRNAQTSRKRNQQNKRHEETEQDRR
jgi:hypothetical protein